MHKQHRVKTSDITNEEILLEIRKRCVDRNYPLPDASLAAKYPVKVILNKMSKMNDAGILNYGVSLRTSWIEEDNEEAGRVAHRLGISHQAAQRHVAEQKIKEMPQLAAVQSLLEGKL